jgi:hypothetical protein
LDHYSKKHKKNNSSREEVYGKNSEIHLDKLENKNRDCKGIIIPVLDKIQDNRRNFSKVKFMQ